MCFFSFCGRTFKWWRRAPLKIIESTWLPGHLCDPATLLSVAALLKKAEHHCCLKRRETSCRHRDTGVTSLPPLSIHYNHILAMLNPCFHLRSEDRLMQTWLGFRKYVQQCSLFNVLFERKQERRSNQSLKSYMHMEGDLWYFWTHAMNISDVL